MGRAATLSLLVCVAGACAAFANGSGGLTNEAANCPPGMQARQGVCWPLDGTRVVDAGDDE